MPKKVIQTINNVCGHAIAARMANRTKLMVFIYLPYTGLVLIDSFLIIHFFKILFWKRFKLL